MTADPAIADLFARAREADLEAVAGVRLFRAGRRVRGECPLCGASKGKKAGGAFSAEPSIGRWNCFGCGEHGDVVDLEQALRGGSLREAAERLAGPALSVRQAVRETPSTASRSPSPSGGGSAAERIGGGIWAGRWRDGDISGEALGRYLGARGLGREIEAIKGRYLGFNPSARWGWDEARRRWIEAPAMVAPVHTEAGKTGGYHVTYLAVDLRAKARLEPAKRMWGPQKDAAGRPGGVWLTSPMGPGPLVVGEGIESTLSAMQLLGRPCRGVATLSLGALQGGWLADRYGRVDPACPTPDPETPAFTWPLSDLGQAEVLIAVDRDMKPIRRKARKLGGGTVDVVLAAEARARICAGLAVAAWKAAGANAVRVIAPAAGRDFNDELLARADRDRVSDPAEGESENWGRAR